MMNGRKIKIFVIEHLVCTKFRFWTTLRRMQHDAQHAPCGCAARRTIYLQLLREASEIGPVRGKQNVSPLNQKSFLTILITKVASQAPWMHNTHHDCAARTTSFAFV